MSVVEAVRTTLARYRPVRSGTRVAQVPFGAVVVILMSIQPPDRFRWTTTVAPEIHPGRPPDALTRPSAIRCPRRRSEMLRLWTWMTTKSCELEALPPGPVTTILPVVAPAGTVAVICVDELTVKLADTPLNKTAVAPVRSTPVITTDVPALPVAGENEVTVGAITKSVELVAAPAELTTLIRPVVAPVGTVAVIRVGEFTVN